MALPTLPVLTAPGGWGELLQPEGRAVLEAVLPTYIHPRRWFGAKTQQIVAAQIVEAFALLSASGSAYLTLVRLAYADGGGDTYVLPLAFAPAAEAERLLHDLPHAAVARVEAREGAGVLFDALFDPSFCTALLDLIAQQRSVAGTSGALHATSTGEFERLRGQRDEALAPKVGTVEQSNSSVIYGERLIMKLFRKIEPGINPDLEIGLFLTAHTSFRHVPPAAGAIEYRGASDEPSGLALLQGFVPNQGDAWSFTLREIARSFQHVLAAQLPPPDEDAQQATLLDLADQTPPDQAREVVAGYGAAAELLGRRTAELHLALAADAADGSFAPEPFDETQRRALSNSLRGRAALSFQTLRRQLDALPEPLRQEGQQILDMEQYILGRFHSALDHPVAALRTRIHGDYHLGQVLRTSTDFFIIDFEGEPARPLHERRIKSSPLQDVAGMLRSFHYAPYAVLLGQAPGVTLPPEDALALAPWARYWQRWASAAFLRGYRAALGQSPLIPQTPGELHLLLDTYLLDKALYELAYELNNRPDWAGIPIEGIRQLLGLPS